MALYLLVILHVNIAYISASINYNCWDVSLFSTKTPYKHATDKYQKPFRPGDSCKPIQINMVHRHGNRYPSVKDIRRMKSMGAKINKGMGTVSPDITLNLPWKCPFTEAQDKLLSSVGEIELYQIGKNIRTHFPELFQRKYSPLLYKFQSTCKLRCTHSSNSLASGLYEYLGNIGDYKYQPIAIKTLPCDNDPILRFFDLCHKYIKEVDNNKLAMREMKEFDNGIEMKHVLEKVVLKLGTSSTQLNVVDLKAIFIACAYDTGMFNGSSGICSLFDQDDISVMEYSYELKHFYKRSAGYDITYESSCPLLRDILDTLKLATNNSADSYLGIFRSAHAETLIPLYAILGVHLDEEILTARNYKEMKKRTFRTGCISPFSGNMYFILYDCGNEGYKIQLYVNERITKIPCCSSAVDCNFNDFLKCYQHFIDKCQFAKMCEIQHTEL